MSLIIYDIDNVPEDLKIIRFNDAYFNKTGIIPDNPLTKEIIKDIDKGEYVSSKVFKGRTKEMGNLDLRMLSTGTKTLLNIINNPDVCFDVCECGDNALSYLFKLRSGIVYWEYPFVISVKDKEDCDIIYWDKHFDNPYDFMTYAVKRGCL